MSHKLQHHPEAVEVGRHNGFGRITIPLLQRLKQSSVMGEVFRIGESAVLRSYVRQAGYLSLIVKRDHEWVARARQYGAIKSIVRTLGGRHVTSRNSFLHGLERNFKIFEFGNCQTFRREFDASLRDMSPELVRERRGFQQYALVEDAATTLRGCGDDHAPASSFFNVTQAMKNTESLTHRIAADPEHRRQVGLGRKLFSRRKLFALDQAGNLSGGLGNYAVAFDGRDCGFQVQYPASGERDTITVYNNESEISLFLPFRSSVIFAEWFRRYDGHNHLKKL
jgi:hypothetical protein